MSIKPLTIVISLMLIGCANNKNYVEWKPLMESSSSEELGVKYGVPNKDHVLDGLIFWEIYPLINQAPYSFQWYGNNLTVWTPKNEIISTHKIKVNECSGLLPQLDSLLDSIGESAKKMMANKQRSTNVIFMGSPIDYRIKYYPPDMLGSITLNNIEYFQSPWISEVKKVKTIVTECIKNITSTSNGTKTVG